MSAEVALPLEAKGDLPADLLDVHDGPKASFLKGWNRSPSKISERVVRLAQLHSVLEDRLAVKQ